MIKTPAQITLTHEQLTVLAGTGETCIVKETTTLVTPVEAWVLDEETHPDEHRTIIVEADGTILSDTILGDQD